MKPANILILPGWQNSGPTHWQSLWEQKHGYHRVEQHDWDHPLRGDWVARLEDVVLSRDEPVVLAAHSMGCLLVAAWAAVSRNTHRVKGALLVAPGGVGGGDLRDQLASGSPIAMGRIPFDSVLLGSEDDPYCALDRARLFAQSWGAQFMNYGRCGHINGDSGLGSWPEGHVLLQDLMKD